MAAVKTITPVNGVSEIDALKAQVAALQAQVAAKNKLSLKVSEKGALSVYGLGRFPQTLYVGQWERLLAYAPEIRTFIDANRDRLARKDGEA